jgi:hypothetical protein
MILVGRCAGQAGMWSHPQLLPAARAVTRLLPEQRQGVPGRRLAAIRGIAHERPPSAVQPDALVAHHLFEKAR